MFALRLIISIALATVVVLVITIAGLKILGEFEPDEPRQRELQSLELLSESDRIDFAEELGLATGTKRPELPAMEDIPPFELPRRGISGFVQVEVSYDEQGRVTDAQVIDATPPGVYEEQALKQVRQTRYAPDRINGRAIPGTVVEIVDFTIPSTDD